MAPVAGLFKCNPSNIRAALYQISTDSMLARSLSDSWASCYYKSFFDVRHESRDTPEEDWATPQVTWTVNLVKIERDSGSGDIRADRQTDIVVPLQGWSSNLNEQWVFLPRGLLYVRALYVLYCNCICPSVHPSVIFVIPVIGPTYQIFSPSDIFALL